MSEFYEDTPGIDRLIVESAAAAAAEVAEIQRRDYETLASGQAEQALHVAVTALEQKHGVDEWERLRPHVQAKIGENPSLIPQASITSPSALAKALDDVLTIVRNDVEQEDLRNHWAGLVAADWKPIRVGRF